MVDFCNLNVFWGGFCWLFQLCVFGFCLFDVVVVGCGFFCVDFLLVVFGFFF